MSSDMSVGQWVGGIVGAIIGAYSSGPYGAVQGFALGAGIGGFVDPPPGPNLRGPTLDDKTFQATSYGVSLPELDGTIATMGTIIYLENNEYKAVSKKESTGGKGGGGGGTYETTTYYATFAVALSSTLPASSVRRIWAGGKLIYSANSGDFDTTLQSMIASDKWHYYDGTQTIPDSRMEGALGFGFCPSYEGTAYIIFYDFDLTTYGNGLAGCPIKVEIACASSSPEESDGFFVGYVDASDAVPTGTIMRSCNPIRMSVKRIISSLAFSYQTGSTAGGYIDFYGPDGDRSKIKKFEAPGGSDGAVMYGESNVRAYWFRGYEDRPGAIYDEFVAVSTGGLAYEFPGWNFSSVHEHTESGLFFKLWKVVGGGTEYALCKSDGTIITVPSASQPVVGGGIVAVCRAGAIDIYSPDLSLLRTVPNLLGITERRGLTAFRTNDNVFILSAQSVQQLNSGVFNYNIIDSVTGSYTSHSLDLGVTFDVAGAGSWENPTLSHVKGIFAYGNTFSRANNAPNAYTFIYFQLPSQYGGIGNVTRGPARVADIVAKHYKKSGLSESDFDLSEIADLEVDGYRVEGPITARGATSQLQAAFLFDVVEWGYQLKAVPRGSAPTVTIPYSDLMLQGGVAVASELDDPVRLPSRYTINYLDYAREYDANSQFALYPVANGSERSEQFAMVMTADKAAQLADVLINLAHIESRSYPLLLSQKYLDLKPSTVASVELRPGYHRALRFETITYSADQTLKVSARAAEQSAYQSAAKGSEVEPPPETIPLISDSTALLLDIPLILNDFDRAGFVAAMYGLGTWPGGVLFRSQDSGQTFNALDSFQGKATVGVAIDVLGADSGAVIDRVSSLELMVVAGDFYAITEAQMMTGKNFVAYGMPGRWEILQYSGAVVSGQNRVVISNFLRGMRGTEWATGLHEADDYFVLLDDPDNRFIGYDLSQLMMSRQFKAVTVGENVADSEVFDFTYTGANLRPLSPINCIGENVAGDWVVSFTPRTRYQGSYWYSGVQPQNEPVLAFSVDIKNGVAIVRTLSLTSPDFIYTQAQQIDDFGSAQSSLNFTIYQMSAAVGRGYPLEVTL